MLTLFFYFPQPTWQYVLSLFLFSQTPWQYVVPFFSLFAFHIPDHAGHARSRRRASARRGEAPLVYEYLIVWCVLLLYLALATKHETYQTFAATHTLVPW